MFELARKCLPKVLGWTMKDNRVRVVVMTSKPMNLGKAPAPPASLRAGLDELLAGWQKSVELSAEQPTIRAGFILCISELKSLIECFSLAEIQGEAATAQMSVFYDSLGVRRDLSNMCRVEPAWAANRIRVMVTAIGQLQAKIEQLTAEINDNG